MILKSFRLPIGVFLFTASMLSMIQLNVSTKMLLFERFLYQGGWIEIFLISTYGAFIIYKMQNQRNSTYWRQVSWTIFSGWFFLQLFLGIFISEKFLLTGKLHLPIPAMMLGGPIYRGQLSIMTLLFLSTIILSGPAWCSHLCYFGAMDGLTAKKGKAKAMPVAKNKMAFKNTILISIIVSALMFRWFGISPLYSTIAGIVVGIIGLVFIIFYSPKKGKMFHCIIYCPIGTLVNYFKAISPFRLVIDKSCTQCMGCTPTCRYDALNLKDIKANKPGITCTLCGDCLSACHDNSLRYKFLKFTPAGSRNLYLFITISLHVLFMALGRI